MSRRTVSIHKWIDDTTRGFQEIGCAGRSIGRAEMATSKPNRRLAELSGLENPQDTAFEEITPRKAACGLCWILNCRIALGSRRTRK
jgi:hypothetical protein